MLSSMREILEHTIGTGIEIRVQADTGLPSLLADKAQLETVLVNLATNARDAMAGTGTLTLSAETRQHGGGPGPPDGLKAGSYVVLTVSDIGIGMDDATLARAPEPFFTTKPTGQGTGLGLAMAAGFAEQSGGGLFIESAPGSGTKVSLWLPVAGMPPGAAGSGLDVAPAISGAEVSARLLVVDDDAIVREGIAERMAAAGYDVLPVESGAVALAMLDAGAAVDMIVTDLSMPGMDGVRLIREAQIRRPGLPSILLTGFATTDESSSQDGKITVLHKPITGKQLAENVAALLARAARLG